VTKDELVDQIGRMPFIIADATDATGRVVERQGAFVSRDAVLALVAEIEDEESEDDDSPVDFLARRAELHEQTKAEVKGDVGTITGPPIVGTNDTINAGPPQLAEGEEPPTQWLYDSTGRIPDDIVRGRRGEDAAGRE
jgi:hypothetical protein